jgi:hypothetical protein
MRDMRLLGVYREKIFSPGKVREDAAILDAALLELSRQGYEVRTLEAEALDLPFPAESPWVLTMAQSDRALHVLETWHERGMGVINSVPSVRNCYRKPLIRLLREAQIPLPESEIVSPDEAEKSLSFRSSRSYWLKRGDVHAIEPADVARVASKEELAGALDHFRRRKIEEILVQEHLEGEVIKFYGVAGGQYFSAFLSSKGEEVTSEMKQLSGVARRSAEAAGLEIYGGDAIVTRQGAIVLIDLNDWPSFSRCCQPAAQGIAKYITGVFEGGIHGSSVSC